MTVSSEISEVSYDTDGVTTAFPVPFYFLANDHLRVWLFYPATGVETDLVLGSGYNVTGAGNPSGGTVTTTVVYAAGPKLRIERRVPVTQETAYQRNDPFPERAHERALDKLTMICQQLAGFFGLLPGSTLRALLLGRNDVDGHGAYRARNNRIQDLGAPIAMNDAARKQDIVEALADLSTDGSGQFVVQRLADASNPTNGANMVGYQPATGPATTVHQALRQVEMKAQDLETDVTQLDTDLHAATIEATLSNLDAGVIDMHFGTLRGLGWNSTEASFTENATTAATAVAAGALVLPVASALGFVAPQLIVYQASNGHYYTTTITNIIGNTLYLGVQTEAAIAVGGLVVNAYRDDAHPNKWGAYAIVDDTLRRLAFTEQLAAVQRNYQDWTAIGAATLSGDIDFSYANPGATNDVAQRSVLVSASAGGTGASSRPIGLPAGTYRITFPVRLNGTVSFGIQEQTKEGATYQIASATAVGSGSVRLMSVVASIRPGSSLAVLATSVGSGAQTFSIGRLSYFRLIGKAPSLNRGIIELFGDSWINGGFITERMQQRLPKATIIQSGVGGNKMSDLLARFQTDVVPNAPDWVFVMCGTNDVYAGVTAKSFESDALVLKSRIKSIGARPVFWNCSVCYKDYSGGDRLSESRRYALQVDYGEQAPIVRWQGAQQDSAVFDRRAVTVPASSSVVLASLPTLTNKSVRLINYVGNVAGLTIYLGFADTIDTITMSGGFVSWPSGTAAKELVAVKEDAYPKCVVVQATNPTGGAIVLTCSFELAWYLD